MSRLPTVGSDNNAWGTVLNDYLTQNVRLHYTLASDSAAGANSITLDKDVAGILAGGFYVAVGATTTSCEIRRVTAVSGGTLTLASPTLKLAHTAGEYVRVLTSSYVTPEWFGCKADDSTFDSYQGLQQAFNNIALMSGKGFGIEGQFARYYSTRPLAVYDFTQLKEITFTVKAPFAIDPMEGLTEGLPDQFFFMMAGQFVTVTNVDADTNEITLSATVANVLGERLIFHPLKGATLPAPLEAGRHYHQKTNTTGNVYTISVDLDGEELDITDVGSGTFYCYSPGVARMRWTDVTIEGGETQGLNGLLAAVQQPSYARSLRVQSFPGPIGVCHLGGQQGYFENLMVTDGSVGLHLGQAEFLYFIGINLEDCDKLCVVDPKDINRTPLSGRENNFYGGHWEAAGGHTSLYQTIVGNAGVSAGTFTLSFNGETTSAIDYNASAATIQSALEALTVIDSGDVTCTDLSGGLPDGSVQIAFGGQYAWATLLGTKKTSVTSTSLVGGTYSMNYYHPDVRTISILGDCYGLNVFGATSASVVGDFLTLESTANEQDMYALHSVITTGQTGNAVKDVPRGITVPWGDALTNGAAERLLFFGAGGRHGGTEANNWWLAGRLGGFLAWDEYDEELTYGGAAKIRFSSDAGPLIASGTGAPAIAAPVGSLYLRTDGGAATSLYVKETGTSTTGWVAK